jgi:hypothetical protein
MVYKDSSQEYDFRNADFFEDFYSTLDSQNFSSDIIVSESSSAEAFSRLGASKSQSDSEK